MTAAVALAQGEYVDCLNCDGTGIRPTGQVDHETGRDRVADCPVCHGDCVVDAEQVSTCVCCTTRFWTGDGCEHRGEPLCADCKGRCTDCVDEAREAAAEATYRELVVLAGGGWS